MIANLLQLSIKQFFTTTKQLVYTFNILSLIPYNAGDNKSQCGCDTSSFLINSVSLLSACIPFLGEAMKACNSWIIWIGYDSLKWLATAKIQILFPQHSILSVHHLCTIMMRVTVQETFKIRKFPNSFNATVIFSWKTFKSTDALSFQWLRVFRHLIEF